MKKTLLTSAAFLLFAATSVFAAVPSLDLDSTVSTVVPNDHFVLAKKGSGNGGGDDSDGGDDHGGNHNDNDDNDDSGDDSADDNSNDDSPLSGSNRRKPRVPGGSGCDGAGDAAEHASCSP